MVEPADGDGFGRLPGVASVAVASVTCISVTSCAVVSGTGGFW